MKMLYFFGTHQYHYYIFLSHSCHTTSEDSYGYFNMFLCLSDLCRHLMLFTLFSKENTALNDTRVMKWLDFWANHSRNSWSMVSRANIVSLSFELLLLSVHRVRGIIHKIYRCVTWTICLSLHKFLHCSDVDGRWTFTAECQWLCVHCHWEDHFL